MFLFFQKSFLKDPVVSFGESPKNVLGLFTSTPSIVGENVDFNYTSLEEYSVTTTTPTKSVKKKITPSKKTKPTLTPIASITPTPTIIPTPSDLVLLSSKIDLIKNYAHSSKNDTTSGELMEAIFEHQLIDTFGATELSRVFVGINDIYFTDIQVIDNEAVVTAVVQYQSNIKTFKCFFVKQNNEWFLYKTQDL